MLRQEDIKEFLRKMSTPDEVKKVEFPSFEVPASKEQMKVGLSYLHDVPVVLTAELGQTTMKIRDIINLDTGSVIELDQVAGENARIMVNGKKLGTGGLVVIGNNFGVRMESVFQITGKDSTGN